MQDEVHDGRLAPSPDHHQQQQQQYHRVLNSASHHHPSLHHMLTHQQQQQQAHQPLFNFDDTTHHQMDQPRMPQASALVQQQIVASASSSVQAAAAATANAAAGKQSLVRTVNPGDRVNIPCSLANMGGSIQFAKDDQPIILDAGCAHCQLDISNDGQASLTINRVSQRDQGHWQCWRLDAAGKVKQKIPIIQLVVTNSPELPILIVNDKELLGGYNLDATITIKENEMVNFKCVIKGASSPVEYVHWILDSSTNVTQMSQLMMEYSAQENNYLTQSVLKLNATKSMNLKSISCLSYHQLWLTPMTVTALLNVLYEPSFTISREPGFGVPVSEGMTVILKCEIDSNPISQPVWIKDADNKTAAAANNAITNTNNAQQQQQQHQFTGKESGAEPIVLDTQEDGSVVFQPARRQDSGWYRCKTENKYGNFSSFGYYLNVRPGSSSSGSPLASAASTGGASAPPTAASNQQASQMRQQARIMSPNQPAAQVGGPNFLQAPPPTLRPQFNSAPAQDSLYASGGGNNNNAGALQRSQHQHQVANDQPAHFNAQHQQQLTNDEQQQQQQQQQRCKSGLQAATNRLDGFPVISNPVSTVQAFLGRQLILPLRFCCNPGPARVFWIHRHLAMIPGRMFGPYITRDVYSTYNSVYCYETTFEIEQVKPEDIGTVYVFVSNEKGHAGAQINIQLAKQTNAASTTTTADTSQHAGPHQFHATTGVNTIGSRFPLLNGGFQASSASPSCWPATRNPNSTWILMVVLVLFASIIIQVSHFTTTNCHLLTAATHCLALPLDGPPKMRAQQRQRQRQQTQQQTQQQQQQKQHEQVQEEQEPKMRIKHEDNR